jgi:hypothetical protein
VTQQALTSHPISVIVDEREQLLDALHKRNPKKARAMLPHCQYIPCCPVPFLEELRAQNET